MDRRTLLKRAIYQALMLPNTVNSINDWEVFYKKYFGLNVDFSRIEIPRKKDNFTRLIIVAKGVNPATKNYAILVRDRIEGDIENSGRSVNTLKRICGNYMTLVERLLFEMKYFTETGGHLDTNDTYTLCASSLNLDGKYPLIYWAGG